MPEICIMQPASGEGSRDRTALPGRRERRLWYPYYHYRVQASTRALWQTRRFAIECLVDARTGRAATADELRVATQRVQGDEVLTATLLAEDARRAAERYASHALSRSLKVLRNFGLEFEDRAVVYRPFEIIRVEGERLLRDTLTGDVHPLSTHERRAESTQPATSAAVG